MSIEPDLPLEFVVRGTAISQQGTSSTREAWKESVRTAARSALPAGAWLLDRPLAVTIFIFPATTMQGDIDNRIKPILDAMVRCVYRDDRLIERLVVQRFEPDSEFAFRSPTAALATAVDAQAPAVYVRVSDDPYEELS